MNVKDANVTASAKDTLEANIAAALKVSEENPIQDGRDIDRQRVLCQ